MSDYPAGTFCWVDLATTDPGAAKEFYAALFGWEGTDVPAGEAGVYTMLRKGGTDVGGLYEFSPEMRKTGVPPHWMSYIYVENVDASAAKVPELGGKVMAPPFDVMDLGRMAAVSDSTGAHFVLWQPKGTKGTVLVNEPGALCWNELYVHDTAAARDFYGGLLGWKTKVSKSPTGDDYFEFVNSERPAGGMMAIKPEWGEVPPNWSVYFVVEKLAATLEQAKQTGGKVAVPPMEVPGIGTFAFLQDPQGAYFAVIEPAPGTAGG
jgi:predicted enzyme related to lactoylglutathione lyase